ncbi:serine-rich adhesin for platelets-like [Myxocyprinus asiaticus]|uniref:serine-rich adhesin for platelets-like n=1 Tax=Myxocyprinus asiaticus TaxID=70543 RepID=UPI002222FFAA|nr:serine-rich adhesin for platelets-like [Myxocyprinus asiaticus]
MVATRRGTRVGSPTKNTSDEASGVTEPTPSTRRTRRRTIIKETQSQSELTSDSQPDKPKDDSAAPSLRASPRKRETRRSRRLPANKKQPDSTHEADVSESESCCSAVSDVHATPRTRRRTAVREKPKGTTQDEASDAESCLSSVSATRSPRARRSLKKRAQTAAASNAAKGDDARDLSGAESCSSVVSFTKVLDTRRITRSHRKTVVATTEADLSEQESCSSSVSALRGSVVRRSTRNQKVKQTEPIPLNLEDTTDTPSSPRSSRSRDRRRKAKSGVEDVYSSEGCKSGPSRSPWRSTRRQAKLNTLVGESDSESVATDVCTSQGSPSSLRGWGTPSSSRTGSASSNRAVPVTRTRSKARDTSDLSITVTKFAAMPEKKQEGKEHEPIPPHPESLPVPKDEKVEDTVEQLDSTITMDTSKAQESTMIEGTFGDLTLFLEQDEPVESSAGAEVEMLEPPSMQETECQVRGVTVFETADLVEDCGTETQVHQEAMAEVDFQVTEDRADTGDVAMENEPEFVEANHAFEDQACSESAKTANLVEDCGTETQKHQDETVAEVGITVTEDKVETGNFAVEENEPEFVEANHAVDDDACSEPPREHTVGATSEDPVPAMDENIMIDIEELEIVDCKKGVVVINDPSDTVKATVDEASITFTDVEGPSSSSITQADLPTAEEPFRKAPPQIGMISLLDNSEDEESADEGLSADEEEEDQSQKAENMQSVEESMYSYGNQMSVEAEAHSNGLFVIDTRPGLRPEGKYYVDAKQTEEEDEEDFVDEEGDEDEDKDSKVLFSSKKPLTQLSSSIDTGLKMKELGGLYISFDGSKPKSLSNSLKMQKKQNNQDELLKKSVIVPDLEKKDAVPPYKESKHAAKLKRKLEREKTAGDGWFNMKAPELTEELKNDLKALKMRSAMDPKRFYKKNDRDGFPKYFQVGTVVDSPVDFYNSRIPKKQRKRTIVEELLADAEFRSYNKKKYQEIMTEKAAHAAGKMHKKKHIFHKKKMNK